MPSIVQPRPGTTVGTRWPAVVVISAALLLACRFFFFLWRNSVDVLFYDQWDFLGPLFLGDSSLWRLFSFQHGPHREGLGLIADKFLYALTRWNARAEAFLIGGCILAAMMLALWLKRRLFGRLEHSDVLIPIIFLTLAQFETLTGTPNAAYAGIPLLLIMLYAGALTLRSYVLRSALVLVINFFLIYTGFGVFMGIVTIGMFALDCYPCLRNKTEVALRVPAIGFLIACLSMASFFMNYLFQPAVDCFEFPYHNPFAYPWFMALMFSTFAGIKTPVVLATLLGLATLLLSIFVIAMHLREAVRVSPLQLTILVMLGFSLLFSFNTAIGRVCSALPNSAQQSRYATLLIPAFLAIYFHLLTLPSEAIRARLLVILGLMLVPGHIHVPRMAGWFVDGKRAWAACYRQTENIAYCDASTGFKIYPDAERTQLKQKLDYLKDRRLNLFAGE